MTGVFNFKINAFPTRRHGKIAERIRLESFLPTCLFKHFNKVVLVLILFEQILGNIQANRKAVNFVNELQSKAFSKPVIKLGFAKVNLSAAIKRSLRDVFEILMHQNISDSSKTNFQRKKFFSGKLLPGLFIRVNEFFKKNCSGLIFTSIVVFRKNVFSSILIRFGFACSATGIPRAWSFFFGSGIEFVNKVGFFTYSTFSVSIFVRLLIVVFIACIKVIATRCVVIPSSEIRSHEFCSFGSKLTIVRTRNSDFLFLGNTRCTLTKKMKFAWRVITRKILSTSFVRSYRTSQFNTISAKDSHYKPFPKIDSRSKDSSFLGHKQPAGVARKLRRISTDPSYV